MDIFVPGRSTTTPMVSPPVMGAHPSRASPLPSAGASANTAPSSRLIAQLPSDWPMPWPMLSLSGRTVDTTPRRIVPLGTPAGSLTSKHERMSDAMGRRKATEASLEVARSLRPPSIVAVPLRMRTVLSRDGSQPGAACMPERAIVNRRIAAGSEGDCSPPERLAMGSGTASGALEAPAAAAADSKREAAAAAAGPGTIGLVLSADGLPSAAPGDLGLLWTISTAGLSSRVAGRADGRRLTRRQGALQQLSAMSPQAQRPKVRNATTA
mmetsp:Transcript_12142/g.47062  ORF Transcript_12142/g.47062 Transcript_12142/m.47062 type:complete len:268 (-) Transcript_12142:259-1062(-)